MRLAAAVAYLSDVNRNLREEAVTVRDQLLVKNDTFEGDSVAQVRELLETIYP